MKKLTAFILTAFTTVASAAIPPATIPEPSNLALLAIGGIAFAIASRSKRDK
jgi:hypothetical protein